MRSSRVFGLESCGVAAGTIALMAIAAGLIAGCGKPGGSAGAKAADATRSDSAGGSVATSASGGATNIYAAAGPNMLSPAAARAKPLVYVPNSLSASVSVIDPAKYTVVRTFHTGNVPQHIVPSYDLSRLWVLNNKSGTLTPIDPVTGRDSTPVPVDDPYNLYYTPDGKYAIVIAERRQRLDFRDRQTMQLEKSVHVQCKGLDHMEFTSDGRYVVATCEFSGHLVKLDLETQTVAGYLLLDPDKLGTAAMPQDIRSSPDGRVFFVADMKANGVYLIDPVALKRIGFIPTGRGAHGIYPSRDGTKLYVTNRGWNTIMGGRHGPGSISVIDPAKEKVVANWPIPGGGSPDMGNVTADGKELWVSGRYDDEVYVFDTDTGKLTHRIPVGREPHGLCVWPQPGRYSLGHTGNMR